MRLFVFRIALGAVALIGAAIATLPAQGQPDAGCQLCVGASGVYIMELVSDPDGLTGGGESSTYCRAPSPFTLEGGCLRLVGNDYLPCEVCIECTFEGSEGFVTCERYVNAQTCGAQWRCNTICCTSAPWITLLNPPAGCDIARVLYLCDPH